MDWLETAGRHSLATEERCKELVGKLCCALGRKAVQNLNMPYVLLKSDGIRETKPIDVQDREEACVKRICKHFNWTCDIAPSPLAINYELVKSRPREYIALGDECTSIRGLSPSRGEGHSAWLVFEDFLEWLSVVEWFSSNDWFRHLDDGYSPWTVKNPFFGKNLKTVEQVDMFLDLLGDSSSAKAEAGSKTKHS